MIELKKIFKVEYGQKIYHSKSGLIEEKGGTPLISTKGIDNGVHGFYNIPAKYNNIITIASTGTVGSSFYHSYDCCVDDNCLTLTPLINLTEHEMFYYAYLINQESYKYLYGRQVTPKRLGNTLIPDLNFVKEKLNGLSVSTIDISKDSKINSTNRINRYSKFKLKDIFKLKLSKPYHKVNLIVKDKSSIGDLIYITRTGLNNGVDGFIKFEPTIIFEKGEAITIGAEGCKAFFQSDSFICGNKVTVLRNKYLNEWNSLYICSVLNKVMAEIFSYGRAATYERLLSLEIQLPSVLINDVETPDWISMENYIKSLEYSNSI